VQNFGAKRNHDLRLCTGIDGRPERRRSGRGAEETRGGQGIPRSGERSQTDRARLRRALGQLDAGDVLVVTRLDRLARSTRDLLNTLATITGRKADFRSLGDTWADTTTPQGRLMFTVLGGLAEFERDLIRARTGEGRERAKARGVKLGRKPKLTEHQKREAIRRRDQDGEPVREIARSYNVSHSTISRLTA
jgi:DNA invertase Pin-like site-specific DNA recombinase